MHELRYINSKSRAVPNKCRFGVIAVAGVHSAMRTDVRFCGAAWWMAAASLMACGTGDSKPAGTPVAGSVAPVMPRPATPSDSTCPRDGLWKACALEDRVAKSGLAFRPAGDSMRVAYLAVPGVRYKIGKTATLVAFFYKDSLTAAKDVTSLDRFRLAPRGDTIGAWPSAPRDVIWSSNLVAVLFDASATQIERMRLTITAGAPQPLSEAAKAAQAADTLAVQRLPPMPSR